MNLFPDDETTDSSKSGSEPPKKPSGQSRDETPKKTARRSRRRLYESPADSKVKTGAQDAEARNESNSSAKSAKSGSAKTTKSSSAKTTAKSKTGSQSGGRKTPRKKAASSTTRSASPKTKQKIQEEVSKAAEAAAQKEAAKAAEAAAETATVIDATPMEAAADNSTHSSDDAAEKTSTRASDAADNAANAERAQSTRADAQQEAQSAASDQAEASEMPGDEAEEEIPVTEATMVPLTPEEERRRLFEAKKIVKRFSLYSAGTGLVPVPWLDVAALTVVQVQMLRRLTEKYDLPFSENDGKAYVGSLLSSLTATTLGLGAASTGLMFFSGVGRLVGFLTMPAFGAAFTYAVGKIFIYHFESGGSFFSFDPEKMKMHFREVYKEAGEVSESWKRDTTTADV